MTDAHKQKRKRTGSRLAVLLLLLVLYALSPHLIYYSSVRLVYFLNSHGVDIDWQSVEPAFETVYAPLEWLNRNVSAVAWFYDWYDGLFN